MRAFWTGPGQRRRATPWPSALSQHVAEPERGLVNEHSNRFDLIAQAPRTAPRRIVHRLARDPGWDVLRLADVPEVGAASHLDWGAQ